MIFDFRDPEQIAAWVRQAPERRLGELKGIVAAQPKWREPARKAWALLKAQRAAPGMGGGIGSSGEPVNA